MSEIVFSFAEALYQLADEQGITDRVLDEMRQIRAAFDECPRYLRILSSPEISKKERCALLDGCFGGKVHTYVLSSMKLMAEKGCIRAFSRCFTRYRELYNEAHGIIEVNVVSAQPLTDGQKERLRQKLEANTGKRVLLETRIDPGCIGGIRIEYNGLSVDDTLRFRLDAVRKALLTTTV